MADYYEQGVVSPRLPMTPTIHNLFHLVMNRGLLNEVGPLIFAEEEFDDEDVSERLRTWMKGQGDLVAFLRTAFLNGYDLHYEYEELLSGLSWDIYDNTAYLYFEEGYPPGLENVLAQWLKDLGDKAPEWVEIQIANTCSKMRPDGWGGRAFAIHKSGKVHSHSTYDWFETLTADRDKNSLREAIYEVVRAYGFNITVKDGIVYSTRNGKTWTFTEPQEEES